MGLWADPQRLVLATAFQVWRFENILAADQTMNGADRYYVPRVGHTTGEIDIHDISVLGDGRIVFVNTAYSCLSLLSPVHAFRLLWKPSFISKLAAEDRCHLNGLAMEAGKPRYVTAVSRSDAADGWRDRRRDGGIVIDADQIKPPGLVRGEGEADLMGAQPVCQATRASDVRCRQLRQRGGR